MPDRSDNMSPKIGVAFQLKQTKYESTSHHPHRTCLICLARFALHGSSNVYFSTVRVQQVTLPFAVWRARTVVTAYEVAQA